MMSRQVRLTAAPTCRKHSGFQLCGARVVAPVQIDIEGMPQAARQPWNLMKFDLESADNKI